MKTKPISPFTQPDPTIPIREGAPPLMRPTKAEIATFPTEAQRLLTSNWQAQQEMLTTQNYNLNWLEGRHILLAGATGPGLGGALATAVMGLRKAASVTVVARDLSRSLGYETGKAMQAQAEAEGWGDRFNWLNSGMELTGKPLQKIVTTLKAVQADRVVYINTVAAALSGLLPNMPPVFFKDADEQELFQWALTPLSEKEIQITKYVMGEMAVRFPQALRDSGIEVEATVFADWRGSLDNISRDPSQPEYGRQGAYSTSLYLPKLTLQQVARDAYGTDNLVLDVFLPMMRTRALSFIPGGILMAGITETLMQKDGVPHVGIPELALGMLDYTGQALTEGYDNPFPRLDSHDSHLDLWLFEVMARLNNNEDSDFYYKRWV
ncbi:hypothetical protein QUF63_02495 [Anaerolineales bacterium HSG25]|nr:hypothetical protein [Anaerolineales bacterium HSG25]